MKLIHVLPLAALTSAFVLPDEQMTSQMIIQPKEASKSILSKLPTLSDIKDSVKEIVEVSGNALDNAFHAASHYHEKSKSSFSCFQSMTAFDVKGWLESGEYITDDFIDHEDEDHPHPPHHRPDHPPHHKKPHHGHGKPNLTVYELIAKSKYTTKLAKLINEYPDLVETLNGTAANYTVFAPTDKAFAKIPKDHKPSKEVIKKILAYHVSPDFYPAGRVLVTHTIPTALGEDTLGGEPQRLRVGLGLRGLTVNFYSRIIAVNIFGTNGVIHGVDSILLPPPPSLKIISLLPGDFSTLSLGLEKTGLFDAIKKAPHEGGTFFAPNNWAFKKLGTRANAFLFSSYGEKYLKALLKYHVVANQTLYSDAFYKAKDALASGELESAGIPKGRFHIDLPTLLDDKSLAIDVVRFGGIIQIRINGFNHIAVQDGIARDGVIHVLSSILIPPKTPGGAHYMGEEIEVEDLKERLDNHFGKDIIQEL
ncbi:FAS1-containing protein [Coleophoma crateriformis]|uniref:FAS1-containing protein n=1 Tax=Coleophoma crateriformis TaxID=565419 RepID=A0A3D8T1U7_9HELO|nr:FAS1-containing protein [Coleophoma crateriformis]